MEGDEISLARDTARTMSEENVAALREAMARFELKGVPDFEMFDPDVDVFNFDSFPVTRPYLGWDGIAAWLGDVSEPFDNFRFQLIDVLAHDDEHVVTTCRVTGDSRSGAPPFDLVWGVVWTFRNSKVVTVRGLRTADEALEAAGLSDRRDTSA
jgi:ketosteroid isomerase-like protein